MTAPEFPIIYWRDDTTKTSNVLYDSVEKLLAAKPEQCLVFDTKAKQLEHILEGGDDPVTNEPALNPVGQITVSKQQGRSAVPTLTLEGNCDHVEKAWRNQLRGFSRKAQVEPQYHKRGIIGLYLPASSDLDDFSLDPTNEIGYTMALPVFDYVSPATIMYFKVNLSMGVLALS
jgi:hypothetical protein